MSSSGFAQGSAPFPPFASDTYAAFPPLPCKLNPRAAPFISGAVHHPPTPISDSPTKSDFSTNSTVLRATPTSTWKDYAPRVPVAGPYGAGPIGHTGQAGHPYYAQERSGTITQANYTAHAGFQAGGSYCGMGGVNYADATHAATFANYGASCLPMGVAPWPGTYDGGAYGYGYLAQPIYASAPEYAAGYGSWNQGGCGKKKRGKRGGKRGGGW